MLMAKVRLTDMVTQRSFLILRNAERAPRRERGVALLWDMLSA